MSKLIINNAMSSTTPCIYCSRPASLRKGHGDHVIPVQLGEFRKDKLFQSICRKCNSKVGKSEQQFLQCAPESILRYVVKPNVPTRRKRGQSQGKGAAGAPARLHAVDHGDHHALVEPCQDNPQNVLPIDQIVIHDEEGKEGFVRLFPGIRLEQLEERIRRTDIEKIHKLWLHCDKDLWSDYVELLRGILPNSSIEELEPTEIGVHKFLGRVTCRVNDHYFRALAKTAFHYYLLYSHRGFKGDEGCFSQLRAFIMNGGNPDQFFGKPCSIFVKPFRRLKGGATLTPTTWCHFFVAEESGNSVGVDMHLFVGPGCIPESHYITLARYASRIVVPSFVWGHVYAYDDPQGSSRYAGQVEELEIARANSRLILSPLDGWRNNLR